MLSHIYHKLALYEYSLSNFYRKVSRRGDEYSSYFYQMSVDEKKHSKMLFSLLNKRGWVVPSKYLVEEMIVNSKITRTNIQVSKRNLLFYLIFKGRSASSYSTKELLTYVSRGEKIAYIYYSILLWLVKCLSYVTQDKVYSLDINILSTIRSEEKKHSNERVSND